MKKHMFTLICALLTSASLLAQESGNATAEPAGKSKKEIIKKGLNFGPLPVVAFDADKGLQLGALLNIFDFGDGSNYPNTRQSLYLEASFFTKGSQLFVISYDNKFLIPGVRWSTSAVLTNEKAMDFYGFNGYMSYYDHEKVKLGNDKDNKLNYIYTPKYRLNRINFNFKTDFTGNIWNNKLFWEAGYHLNNIKAGYDDRQALNLDKINKGKDDYKKFPETEPTLFDLYRRWGIISEDEAWGGFSSALRLGLLLDTRDKEGAPSKGIWAEAHVTLAPDWLGTTHPYYRYSATFRHYVPIVKDDVLTFAYRLNYEGTFGNSAPYYMLPFITVMGATYDRDGMGGYRTVRGIMRDRVQGLDMATYNVELRWRFVNFRKWNQNIAFGLNLFSDGTMVTRNYDMSFRGADEHRAEYDEYMAQSDLSKDRPHITVGAGLRFIMNQNFIVAFEYGMPISKFSSDKAIKKQDGNGAFYINTGYLF
ncbi:MAG: BamA/TamA family outer membrane protein [Bacteroidaceae bacterium]|nr:BamA/TamA family outer membrane protein [Bacteroidaceae bacterium]